MVEKYTREELAEKAGGYFKLCALINKRKKELATGMPPFVNIESDDMDDIVAEEIMLGKIKLKQAKYSPSDSVDSNKLDLIR
ncbi:DNA-directed RNA polymerase subunit omega [Planctomycetota bacterium]